ncbi:hypothetical protein D3C72_196620 [compost metagenome]
MKRTVALFLLAASLISGCGTSPFAPQTTSSANGAVSARETGAQIQIFDAFKRVETSNTTRVAVMYWVRKEGVNREFRQLIFDGVPTQDRAQYRSGYRPMQMVMNGQNVLQNETSLLAIARELGELNYHTITKEQKQIVALAYEIVMDQVH